MNEIYEGQWLNSHAFGRIVVRKIYMHRETGQLVLDCKSEHGDNLHLSMAYGRRLLER